MKLFTRLPDDEPPFWLPQAVIPRVVASRTPTFQKIVRYLWAMPTSAVAFPLVAANALCGGQTIVWHGILEVQGPLVRKVIHHKAFQAAALTLGHVVLCADDHARRRFRAHELVHVQQAERWGPLFLPIYLGLAAWTWHKTGNGYWNHPWEVEARQKSGI